MNLLHTHTHTHYTHTHTQANILTNKPNSRGLTLDNEALHATLKLNSVKTDPHLKPFADLAEHCLVANFRKRPTAEELLSELGQFSTP